MADLRYPSNISQDNSPFVLFTTHRARYNTLGNKITVSPTGNSVALYMPSYSVNDMLTWSDEEGGIIGNAFQRSRSGNTAVTKDDMLAIINNYAEEIAGGVGAFAGNLFPSGNAATNALSTGIGAITGHTVITGVKNEYSKQRQKILNPRGFILFKSPALKTYLFDFKFMPESPEEADVIPEMIKFFRIAAYPIVTSGGFEYTFPEAFNINFGNQPTVIKVPEVVCTGIKTDYNPTNVAYFLRNNQPVEITLQVAFKELMPIDKSMVARGY